MKVGADLLREHYQPRHTHWPLCRPNQTDDYTYTRIPSIPMAKWVSDPTPVLRTRTQSVCRPTQSGLWLPRSRQTFPCASSHGISVIIDSVWRFVDSVEWALGDLERWYAVDSRLARFIMNNSTQWRNTAKMRECQLLSLHTNWNLSLAFHYFNTIWYL